jgi:DegV family protein with EDD domain
MNKYVIVTDSCCDLPLSIIKEHDLRVFPLRFTIENKTYSNDQEKEEMSTPTFYTLLREGAISSTSQINPNEFIEGVTPLLQQGFDILYIGFSSALSGTYNSFVLAKEELKETFPDRTILTVDSLCASLGQGLLVHSAATRKVSGKNIHEVATWVEENKLKLVHLFTVDDLNFLKRGGRLSSTSAFIGTLLQLKPLLHVSNEGKLVPYGKTLGRKHSIKKLVDYLVATIVHPEEQVVFISHGDAFEEAQYAGNMIKDKCHVKDVIYHYVGPVIGSHSGPGTIAIFYYADKR